jgi:hypothetical protein
MTLPVAVFIIHLSQDVSVLRPLIVMATRDCGFAARLLVSTKLGARDKLGIWRQELAEIAQQAGATLHDFHDDWEAHREMAGAALIVAASESHLSNHATAHNLMQHGPPGALRVTVQHGFECVGFRHSADHDRAYGRTASFGADLLCAWSDGGSTSMAPSQRSKVVVTGPTSVLQLPSAPIHRQPHAPGIVCENLHSVRMSGAGDFRMEFIKTFSLFSKLLARRRRKVVLRPHPGGQYAVRANFPLPANASIENAPIYRLDLRQYSYAISAPSSVVVVMMMAGIPTAIWRNRGGGIDVSNYEGLPIISSPEEWARFARDAERDPRPLVAVQQAFLEKQNLILDSRDVFGRFAAIFAAARNAA